jgi:hypothetical protein
MLCLADPKCTPRAIASHRRRPTASQVLGDTVVLSGRVGSWTERQAVIGAAKGTPGVARIEDQLRIEL